MTEINFWFDPLNEKDAQEIALNIQERLSLLEMVKEVEAVPGEQLRLTGAEIVAAIGVTVLVIRGGRELIEEIRQVIAEVRALIHDVREIRRAYVEIGSKKVPLSELTEEQLSQLVN